MIAEGRIGPVYGSDGSQQTARLGRFGTLAANDAHAHFWEAVSRGLVFTASVPAAGVVVPSVAAAAAAVAFAIQNPKNSGKIMTILKSAFSVITTGTVSPGAMYYVIQNNPAAALVTGTAITPTNNLIGGPAGVGLAFFTSTFPAAPSLLRPAFQNGSYATTNTNAAQQLVDNIDGEIVLAPGTALGIQIIGAAAVGSTWLASLTWQEDQI